MKKYLLTLLFIGIVSLNLSAKLKFKSFEASRNSCVIEMTDDAPGKLITSDGAWLKNDGKEYDATWYRCQLENGKVTFRAVFPFQPSLRNVTIILDINGKKVKKNIQADILDYLSTNPYLR